MAGIYIHIPFCRQKCNYCNFYSVASRRMQEGFIPALLEEIEMQREYLLNEPIDSVYFGGGTPSFIDPSEIGTILEHLHKNFQLANKCEITLEANPDDISSAAVSSWQHLGINRMSLGIQSFHDTDLEYLYRTHNGRTAKSAIEVILGSGINNLSIDLIYGIPTLNYKMWESNLEQVRAFKIPHLSAYWLTVEEGTVLQKLITRKKLALPDDEAGMAQFQLLRQWAHDNDYTHYEISNFGKQGFFSHHNQSYWNGTKYLGLGPSAHSFNGDTRQWNVSSISTYKEKLNHGIIPAETEELTPLIRYEEKIMTGLRTLWGVDLKAVEGHFGFRIRQLCLKQAQPYLIAGSLVLEEDHLKLGEAGYLISDRIIADLFIGTEEWNG